LAAQGRLPSIGFTEIASGGGLIGYGVDFPAMYRRAAFFVDRILQGANPGEIPIERATRFELVVNATRVRCRRRLGMMPLSPSARPHNFSTSPLVVPY